jgi:hypothetical protein
MLVTKTEVTEHVGDMNQVDRLLDTIPGLVDTSDYDPDSENSNASSIPFEEHGN